MKAFKDTSDNYLREKLMHKQKRNWMKKMCMLKLQSYWKKIRQLKIFEKPLFRLMGWLMKLEKSQLLLIVDLDSDKKNDFKKNKKKSLLQDICWVFTSIRDLQKTITYSNLKLTKKPNARSIFFWKWRYFTHVHLGKMAKETFMFCRNIIVKYI